MAEDIFYPHTCEIKRSTGATNSDGDELFEMIYNGRCGLQYHSNGDTSYQGYSYQTFPNLILPEHNILFEINDLVEVYTQNGRKQEFTVENFESTHDEELSGTTIWLKYGTDF